MSLKPPSILSSSLFEMAKQFYACNWVLSRVTEEQLDGCVRTGVLPKQSEIHWHILGPENPPTPKDGEVVVFVDHMTVVLNRLDQSFSVMYLPAFRSTLKILDPTLYPISTTFRFLWSVSTRRTNCQVVPGFFLFEPLYWIRRWAQHWTWRRLHSEKEGCQLPSHKTSQPS